MIFSQGGVGKNVFWYRCASNAEVFPGETAFSSLDQAEDIPAEDIGEIRPPRGDWRNGQRPALYNGKGFFRGTLEQFAEGQQAGVLEVVGVTVVNEPLDLATGPGPFQFPNSSEDFDENFFEARLGVRWQESVDVPLPPTTFNVQLYGGVPAAGADGAFTVTFDPASRTWKGTTVFACTAGGTFSADCECELQTVNNMKVTMTTESGGCASVGTLTSEGAFVPFDNTTLLPYYPISGSVPGWDSPPPVNLSFNL
jgi:hypothetical protein